MYKSRYHSWVEPAVLGHAGACSTVHIFRSARAQLSSPAKHALPDLAGVEIRNASRSLFCHDPLLRLMHWHHLPRAEAFQVPFGIVHRGDDVLIACKADW